MSKKPSPHFAWTAVVVLAVAVLSVAAWLLWSRPESAPSGATAPAVEGSPDSEPAAMAAQADAARKAAIQSADHAMEMGQFQAAAETLDRAEERFGWSDELRATATRLSLRESAFREALRPIEFRIESLVVDPEAGDVELYARYTVEGVPVFASELLVPTNLEGSVDGNRGLERSHIAVLRTSFARGLSLEIVEPGGIFDSDEVLFGPMPLSPLPNTEGGQLDSTDADARVLSVCVSYRASPFEPGVHMDDRPAEPPADATADQLFHGITLALQRDDIMVASALKDRLAAAFPAHRDLEFFTKSIQARTDILRQNRSTTTFTILELTVDPRPDGAGETALWASAGQAPAFHSSIRTTDGLVLADTEDARTAPYLIPGGTRPAPAGNVLRVVARGAAPLTLVVKDSSPRFSSRVVGDIDLPVSLSELPRGTGTIVIERQPRVLIQPGSEPNRIRRVVLRWTVAR